MKTLTVLGVFALSTYANMAFDVALVADTSATLLGKPSNFGVSPTLRVDATHNALFKFDLSFLPVGTTPSNVIAATLTVFVTKATKPGTINLFRVNGDWTEQAPPVTTFLPVNEPKSSAAISINQRSVFVRFDVTSLVKAWMNGETNVGIAIGSTNAALLLRSKEGSGGGVASLQVELSPLQGPTGAKGDKGDSGIAGKNGEMGPPGPPGEAGPIGPIGPKGDKGDPGLKGDTGATGPNGAPGTIGPTGSSGILATTFSTECMTNCIGGVGSVGDTNNYHFVSPTALITVGATQKVFVISTVIGNALGGSYGSHMKFAVGLQAIGDSQAIPVTAVSQYDSSGLVSIAKQALLTLAPGSYYVGVVGGYPEAYPYYINWGFSDGGTTVFVLNQ